MSTMIQRLWMALIHVIVALFLFIDVSSSQTAFCIWGKIGLNSMINGLYKEYGSHNNKPVYKKALNCSTGELYVVWSDINLGWAIQPAMDTLNRYAFCAETALANCQTWMVWNRAALTWDTDSSVRTIADSCPTWDCDQIAVSTLATTTGCNVLFDTHISDNLWTNSMGTQRYWYFNEVLFAWTCVAENPTNYACSSSWPFYGKLSDGWTDVEQTEIECILRSNDSNAPTNNPIHSATNNPSQSPTANPSPMAISSAPSTIPSSNPSVAPSSDPSQTETSLSFSSSDEIKITSSTTSPIEPFDPVNQANILWIWSSTAVTVGVIYVQG